jgi:hypothetical protein
MRCMAAIQAGALYFLRYFFSAPKKIVPAALGAGFDLGVAEIAGLEHLAGKRGNLVLFAQRFVQVRLGMTVCVEARGFAEELEYPMGRPLRAPEIDIPSRARNK